MCEETRLPYALCYLKLKEPQPWAVPEEILPLQPGKDHPNAPIFLPRAHLLPLFPPHKRNHKGAWWNTGGIKNSPRPGGVGVLSDSKSSEEKRAAAVS